MPQYNTDVKDNAAKLRKKGFSLYEISHRMNIPKNTVQGWVKNIRLTKSSRLRITNKITMGGLKGRLKAREVNRHKIDRWKQDIRARADDCVRVIAQNTKIEKLICGILYLCEGAKYPATRHMVFGNSDPRMIKLFIRLLKRNFELDNKKFRCRIMHRWDQDGAKLNRYWSKETGIPLSQFYKSYLDKRTKGMPTKKEGYKGICAIKYFDTSIQFELQAIGEALF